MHVAVIGRGNVGGGLAARSRRAGHTVTDAADDEAREVTEQLLRDAGYEPVHVGGLDRARALEDHLALLGAIGPSFYRY
jgi:predicted dinucleotide-binding enzyme